MDVDRVAGVAGIVAAIAVAGLAAWPYLLAEPRTVAAYVGPGLGGLPLIALLSLLAALVLGAGLTRRSDPAVMAGGAVALGGIAAALALSWLLAVGGALEPVHPFSYHRQLLVFGTVAMTLAATAYARAVV